MISLTEMEEIAVQFGNSYTECLSIYQRDRCLARIEEARGFRLTSDERQAVMARVDDYHTAHNENRPVRPAKQAKILFFRLKDDPA